MSISDILNALVSGLLTGLVYGLSALGLSVIFGVIRIVNFAHGEIMVLGMFLALVLFQSFGLDPLLSVPIAAVVLFSGGYALQTVVISRVAHLPEHMQFMLLAAIAIMLVSACLLFFGPDPHGVDVSYALDSIAIGSLIIDKPKLFAAIAAVIVGSSVVISASGDAQILNIPLRWIGVAGYLFAGMLGAGLVWAILRSGRLS